MRKINWKTTYLDHPLWRWILDITIITALTVLFSWLIVQGKLTGKLFQSVSDIDTPELIDLYTLSVNRSPVKQQSDIVLLPIDGCSRQQVTSLIKALRPMPVSAIGVDITFPYSEEKDMELIDAILSDERIVMASRENGSYFEKALESLGTSFGSIRLDVDTRYDVVRSFTYTHPCQSGALSSFESQLAHIAQPESYEHLFPLDKSSYISYANVHFDTIPATLLLDSMRDTELIANRLKGKIVLLGDLNQVSDTYRTPLQPDMPGVVIHAYVLSTMLYHRYIRTPPVEFSWVMAIIISIFFSWLMLVFKWKMEDAEGLLLRVTQLVLMLIVVCFGVLAFNYLHLYFNMEPIFFALAIQAVMLDIWVGIMGLIYKIFKI